MRQPELFEPMVCVCMLGVAALYWTVGALGYLAFGPDTQVRTGALRPEVASG